MSAAVADPVLTDEQKKEITGLAQQYLRERAERLVVGTARASQAMTSVRTSSALSQRFAAEARGLDERRETFRQVSGGKRAASVELEDPRFSESDKGVVRLDAKESTKLFFMRTGPGAPDHEQFWIDHTFVFTRGSQGWTLSDTTPHVAPGILPATQLASTMPAAAAEKPMTDQLPARSTTDRSDVTISAPPAKKFGEVGTAGPPYDYSAMTNYAVRYAKSYNPSYRAYPNDCTNFISQAMQAGRWDYVGGGIFDRTDPTKWFYGGGPGETFLTSYTWAGAHNWGYFAQIHSKRTSGLPNVWLMDLADVLQVEWTHDGDSAGTIDHSMIVTGRYGISGDPYARELFMTYHTNDQLHKPLSEIIAGAQDPRNKWYAHRT